MTIRPDAMTVLNAMGESAALGGNPPWWADAMAARPSGPIPFLAPAALPARRLAAGLPADHDPLLGGMAATITADPALLAFAWYLHWRVFVAPEKGVPWGAPSLVGRLGDRAGLFYLLLALEFPPALAAWHRRLGYPPEVTAQTVRQIACYESNHLRGRGAPGMYENQFPWLSGYLVDPYVRLGRFEYQLHPYGGGVSVWKRISDGQTLALAGDDVAETPGAVAGFPVDPAGTVLRAAVRLDRAAWSPCLRKGDMVLDLHIPAGGGMDWESVTDSFRQALAFFPRHHPDRPFAAVTCGTWFLDPQLADLLPPDANPLRLQRAVHLYPLDWGPGGLWFVFLRDPSNTDPATLPRDTSLRRALAGFLEKGGKWQCGGMFLLKEDMASLREGLYRDRFRALLPQLQPQ
jgi:hypothetical protein